MSGLSAPPTISPATETVSQELPVSDRETAPQLDHHPPSPSLKRGLHSIFVVAFALYLLLNLYLSYAQPIAFDSYKFTYPSWAWWTFHDLKQNSDIHNVAVMGSSLMIRATNDCDATYLNEKLDLTAYHKASYLDSLLRSEFGGRFNTYDLAAPGLMPSDAFFMLKAMVNTSERPDVVVYGVAPRDFIDSTLTSPVDTEHFHYLTRLVNADDVSKRLFRSPISKLDFWLQHVLYGYGNSLNFQMAFLDDMKELIGHAVACPFSDHPFTYWDRVQLLPNYLPGEIKAGAVTILPQTIDDARKDFKDTTQEYIERYKRPDPHIYKTQFYFLKELADYCHREKIELILVNMPITRMNVMLLKPIWYVSYIQALREFAMYQNVPFFNLSDFDGYPNEYYHDCVHLNAFGGRKFFDSLVKSIKESPRTQTAMELAGKELERQEFLARSTRVGIQ